MSGDILQDIDASIDNARQEFCACGCGVRLRADGPSFYYATQDCQTTAMRSGTRDPDAVQFRRDYSFYTETGGWSDSATFSTDTETPVIRQRSDAWPTIAAADSAVIHFNRAVEDARAAVLSRGAVSFYLGGNWVDVGYTDDGDGLRFAATDPPPAMTVPPALVFQRRCVRCNEYGEPVVQHEASVARAETFYDRVLESVWRTYQREPTTRHCCPHCGHIHDPALYASVERRPESPNAWWLRLRHEHRYTAYCLTDLSLDRIIDPDTYVRGIWQRMIADLLACAWEANDGSAPYTATDETHLFEHQALDEINTAGGLVTSPHWYATSTPTFATGGFIPQRVRATSDRPHHIHWAHNPAPATAWSDPAANPMADMLAWVQRMRDENRMTVEQMRSLIGLTNGYVQPDAPPPPRDLRAAVDAATSEAELADPRARALWLRRHRNTGPDTSRRGRPPRSIDPGRRR